MSDIATFLMFSGDQEGKAEEAMRLYTTLFPNSEISEIERWGPGEPGTPGSVKVGRFSLHGAQFMASDSAVPHNFSFTPSVSIFVECKSDTEIEKTFSSLSDGGIALMPLDNYGFSTRFGWVQDRYGVSWQLNLL